MSTAYIVQDSKRNLDVSQKEISTGDGSRPFIPCSEVYDEFTYLFEKVNAGGYDSSIASIACRRKLIHFCDDDAIVAIGAPFLIGAAIAWAAAHNQGRVKVLEWDRYVDAYRIRVLNMFDKKGEVKDDSPF